MRAETTLVLDNSSNRHCEDHVASSVCFFEHPLEMERRAVRKFKNE